MAYDQQEKKSDDKGQKYPTDESPVKQRHQLGTPPGQKDGNPIPKAP